MFRSQKKGKGGQPRAITARQAERIVKLRHAHASHAMERGAKIRLVQATLGHPDISTTGRYLHARAEESSALYLGS